MSDSFIFPNKNDYDTERQWHWAASTWPHLWSMPAEVFPEEVDVAPSGQVAWPLGRTSTVILRPSYLFKTERDALLHAISEQKKKVERVTSELERLTKRLKEVRNEQS